MLGFAVFLLVLWVIGTLFFKALGGLIHLLLIVAVVVVVYRLVKGRRPIP